MKKIMPPIVRVCCALLVSSAGSVYGSQAEYNREVDARFTKAMEDSLANPRTPADRRAFIMFYLDRDIDKANELVLDYCTNKKNPWSRQTWPFWIAALKATRARLAPEVLAVIEDNAWQALPTIDPNKMGADDANKSFWEIQRGENGFMGDKLSRYLLALHVVDASTKYGPKTDFKGKPIEQHVDEWQGFLERYFRECALNGGTDIEVAHPSTYAAVKMMGTYTYYALARSTKLKRLIGDYLTLYWAEAVTEFSPQTGQRMGWAATRNSNYTGSRLRWERPLLGLYGWHDIAEGAPLGFPVHALSGYHPPEILRAIARDTNRGAYLASSRRMGLVIKPSNANGGIVGLDEDGNSHLRRDTWYTPDYALSTLSYGPTKRYRNEIILNQTMGATFAADPHARITVMGLGYYPYRAINGITGSGVSIVARDPNAAVSNRRFGSIGTRVFVKKGDLWDSRVEDPSGWVFTHCGNAYAAIFIPGGYTISDKTFKKGRGVSEEVPETSGCHLIPNDIWAPVILQMGRAKDYGSFEAFQKSVKENPFTYQDGKLSYTSEAGDTYEVWAKFPQLPKINGATIDLNPEHTYNSPFLKMKHGTDKAVISYPGYEDVVLEF